MEKRRRGRAAPSVNRPCRPCWYDYKDQKADDPSSPRPLDRPLPLDYRLRSGFYTLEGGSGTSDDWWDNIKRR